MVEAPAKARGIAPIPHELRYEPNRRRARDLIRAGAIGPVLHIELLLKPYIRGDRRPPAFDAPWSWWYDATRCGSILGAVGSHLIDLCRFWTGSEVAEVQGRTATFVPERYDEQRVRRPATADEEASFGLRSSGVRE